MKKTKKILFILLILTTIFLTSNTLYAADKIDIFGAGDAFIEEGMDDSKIDDVKDGIGDILDIAMNPDKIIDGLFGVGGKWVAKDIFMSMIDALWSIGLLVIFISTVVLGIKYMFVLPQEKSRLKQATTPYIIGVVIIFGATTIWKFLIWILDGSI